MLALKKPDVTTDEDPADIDRAVSGDVEAFERLYNRHVGRVQGLARWLLGREDVEDVVQDIFIRVWQKLGTFKGNSSFATWLHRLATNVILRRRQQTRAHETRHSERESSTACETIEKETVSGSFTLASVHVSSARWFA